MSDSLIIKKFRRNAWKRQHHRCYWCKEPLKEEEATADHVLPRRFGGRTTIDNIVATCASCNHDRDISMGGSFVMSVGDDTHHSPFAILKQQQS
jgi:5-methylcytosine-specific restriction endonuclease McrA